MLACATVAAVGSKQAAVLIARHASAGMPTARVPRAARAVRLDGTRTALGRLASTAKPGESQALTSRRVASVVQSGGSRRCLLRLSAKAALLDGRSVTKVLQIAASRAHRCTTVVCVMQASHRNRHAVLRLAGSQKQLHSWQSWLSWLLRLHFS